MDVASLAQVQADLVAWGLLEAARPDQLSRRGRAAMARAAAFLREEEVQGRARPGHPLLLTSEIVITGVLPDGAKATVEHHRFLAAVELASLPEGIRGMFG